jgi:predicted nuclease with TOPRIM domain
MTRALIGELVEMREINRTLVEDLDESRRVGTELRRECERLRGKLADEERRRHLAFAELQQALSTLRAMRTGAYSRFYSGATLVAERG